MNGYRRGIWGEYYAAIYLVFKGYRIVKMRYKTRVGEIDLIARRGKTIAFIEVKYRKNLSDGGEAISLKSQSRIRRTAEQYMVEYLNESHNIDIQIRMDAMIVTHKLFIHHIKNAF